MSEPNTKDNLARIRDNQRRSRARRKEYLQELEAKYRTCEQLGVQASAEIQAAAKRVLDENKRLRALLHEKGVSDAEIDSFTDRDPSLAASAPVPAPAQNLDTLLNTRRSCNPQSGCGDSSSDRKSPVHQRPVAVPLVAANEESVQPRQQLQRPAQPFVEPVSRHSSLSTPSTAQSPISMGTPLQQFSTSNPGVSTALYGATVQYAPFTQYYGMPMQNSWQYTADDLASSTTQHSDNTSSCVYAANIIRGMRNDVGPELEQDLGCPTAGQDCKVDNNVVFELVDKYSMQGI